jgi:hypothetical protein
MRITLLHHASDAGMAGRVRAELTEQGYELVAAPGEAEVVLLLVSRAALRDGLGTGPAEAVAAGIHVLPLLVGGDALPPGFPVHKKHAPLAGNVEAIVAHVVAHREAGEARQIDSKRDLFGLGVLLALCTAAERPSHVPASCCARHGYTGAMTTPKMPNARPEEIIFSVRESAEGGYEAAALGFDIFTEADDMIQLRTQVRDAVRCHFDAEQAPRVIRLHLVREEVLPA